LVERLGLERMEKLWTTALLRQFLAGPCCDHAVAIEEVGRVFRSERLRS
jgi:hypothetical protein